MKTPEILIWIKPMKYEYYKSQVEAWNNDNLESDKKKFDRLIESFKKNTKVKKLKSFASTIVLSKLRKFEQQTVNDILILLEERFGRTKTEKIDDLIMTMKNGFKVSSVPTEQS